MTETIESTLKQIKRFLKTDDEGLLYVNPPKQYEDFPTLREAKGLIPFEEKSIIDYLKDFTVTTLDSYRIMEINGIELGDSGMMCDYCKTLCKIDRKYCMDCHKDMCLLCFEEDEEKAKQNNCKNYHKRKDDLELCKTHKLIDRSIWGRDCNKCYEYIYEEEWYHDKKANEDYHLACKPDKDVEKCKLDVDQLQYGSFVDWIPIYNDIDKENSIYLNLNKESPYFHRISVSSMDNHGRMGFYITDYTLDTLEELLCILEKYYDVWCEKYPPDENSWEKVYDAPIKTFMESKNMPIHYG